MSDNNVLNLATYLQSQKPLPTVDADEMETFSIYKEKTLARRVFAFMCDFFVVATFKNMASVSYALAVNELLQPLSGAQRMAIIRPSMLMEAAVFLTIFFTYFFYCNYVLNGKTLGGFLMKLNVIDDNYPFDHQQTRHWPKVSQAAKRAAGYVVCYLSFGTFFFLSLLNDEKLGVPDFISGTRVVSDEWLKGYKAYKKYDQDQVRININSLDKAA